MNSDEFSKQQYITLRAEISESKARVFWLLILGVFLVLASGYLAAEHPSAFANGAIPILILALMLSFIAEESNISRAGRYLRDVIEPQIQENITWERWLESHGRYREVDRAFVVGFNVIFLIFFIISATLSVKQLDQGIQPKLLVWTAGTAYTLGAICVLYVFARHWAASTATITEE